jgi:NSS family neurotransmitter:Na+ symporter
MIFAPSEGISAQSVLVALGHSFFTLSLGMGAMITYGSDLGKNESVVTSAFSVVVLDTVIALVATVIMFSVIFSTPGMDEQLGKSTAGMLFITLPKLFYTVVPFGTVLAPLFYLLVGFAALTSTISILEVVVAYFIDSRGMPRRSATLLCTGLVGAVMLLCGLSNGANGGLSNMTLLAGTGVGEVLFAGKAGLFNLLDHLSANWMLPIGGLLIILSASWVVKPAVSREELTGDDTPAWFHYGIWLWVARLVSPAAILYILYNVIIGKADFT